MSYLCGSVQRFEDSPIVLIRNPQTQQEAGQEQQIWCVLGRIRLDLFEQILGNRLSVENLIFLPNLACEDGASHPLVINLLFPPIIG